MSSFNSYCCHCLHRGRHLLTRSLRVLTLLAVVLSSVAPVLSPIAVAAPATAPAAQTATNALTLNVLSARTEARAFGGIGVTKGDPIPAFKYIINIDNTGTTTQRSDPVTGAPPIECTPADPGYPASCQWVSIAGAASSSPIYTQGDQSDFANGVFQLGDLPNGRYLISVIADGYRLDGAHFTMPAAQPVTVELQPFPLPDATIRAFVFDDISPTNGAPDVPAESGIGGFAGHIADYIGEVTTDVYGNPLCTRYVGEDPDTFVIDPNALDAEMLPVIKTMGGQCLSKMPGTPQQAAADPYLYTTDPLQVGMLVIPHLGPNRYALSAVAPDGSGWIQTTTLEGNHDWDAWVMEGATGFDTEFVVAGEPFPAIIFGFVQPTNTLTSGAGTIQGVVDAFKAYVPAKGGVTSYEPFIGARIDKPIDRPWLALSDLGAGDTAVWIGQGDANGAFTIPNVPDGTYTLTWWDEPQDYILNLRNVTVANGETVNLGVLPLNGWWTTLDGYVFNDANRNGIFDWIDLNGDGCPGGPGEGETALSNFTLSMRKRENSVMDRGATLVTTDGCGYYYMENAYPMTQWLVMEAYSDLYYTTGVTYQADNQPTPTTVLGAGVDVSVLPIIGLSGRMDWGVHTYAPTGGTPGIDPDNGGIVGTVSYDTTRNEIDPRFAAVEDWQPGISGLTVNLYTTVDCPANGSAPCDPTGLHQLDTDGSLLKGSLINSYVTETWERPAADCIPRDVDGNPLAYPTDQAVTSAATDCLEGPLMGVQFGTYASDQGTPNANFGAAVDGNYGFGDGCFGAGGATGPQTCADGSDPTALPAADYLVEVASPVDALGRPMYQVTREEDINIANGDQFIPQIPPPACAGPLHTVDVAGIGTDGWSAIVGDGTNGVPTGVTVPTSTPVDNPTFAQELNGSYYEGQPKPLCNTKLVTLSNGKSVAPLFNYFTAVPLPGRFWGLLVDDLNFSSDPKSLLYGEKAGVPFAPVGIYDWTNRLVATIESDYNGLWDVLLPSSNRINCPTPSGVCANLYRFVGNDPGTPGRLNLNFKPQFRTIAAEFEAFPGLMVPADLAPTQVGLTVQLPGGQFNQVACTVNDPDPTVPLTRPELFAASQPYADFRSSNVDASFTVTGQGFGASGQVSLDGVALPTTSWSDTDIAVTVPATTPIGPHQLKITRADNGNSTINGLTFHVMGSQWPAFSSTPVLDNFNRGTGGLGNNWSSGNSQGGYRIQGNPQSARYVQVRNNPGPNVWNPTSFGANQEAYFTFTQVSTNAAEQGVFLKYVASGGGNTTPTDFNSAYIEVAYNAAASTVVVRTKASGQPQNQAATRATFPNVSYAVGDTLGARTLADGTVIAYRNGVEIGSVNVTNTGPTPYWPAANAAGGGRIGVWFVGTSNNNDARFDDFGGGTVFLTTYPQNLYEVGPGRTYAVIQDAIDAATTSPGNDLVVVYPGTPDLSNPRYNPRGAYYENLIFTAPIKLQGVGPGGIQQATNTTVPGSIIDGSAFGGDTALADAWRARIDSLFVALPDGTDVPTWLGNPTVSEGQAIYLLAFSENQYGAAFKAAIDGFDIRGGDQQGQANLITQGGAIFANAYIRNLQVTNNVVEGNSSSYGTIRIGTPDLTPASNFNENLRIANNRIIHNAGTNLAGAIALFAGADNYDVAGNDLCGNFSAEYGGGMTVYGLSPNGRIHDNRIYFNESYDEGGGIMIAGALPADPLANYGTPNGPQGSGPVEIYNNLIQNNMANDDGGGLRFLMAGNFPMSVYNNMIVNNVSTHEGGGIGLNDAPNVRLYNNTVAKNMTTATAVTSSGFPAPAGLSTSANSDQLQATLPGGSPLFSNPLLFNNIFWDNRAGTRGIGTVTGLSDADANVWDLGVADGSGALTVDGSNLVGVDPLFVSAYSLALSFAAWRNNPTFVDAIMVVNNLPPNLLGDYHLQAGSPATDTTAVASMAVPGYQQPPATVDAPLTDIDNQLRPAGAGYDIGADEYGAAAAVAMPASVAGRQSDATEHTPDLVPQLFMPLVSGGSGVTTTVAPASVQSDQQLYLPSVNR